MSHFGVKEVNSEKSRALHTLKRAENGQEIKQNFKYMQDENSLSLENAVLTVVLLLLCTVVVEGKAKRQKNYKTRNYEL